MRAAIREARKGMGQTSPNPAVGAVLVVNGRIVARGHHRRAGEPHAEVECLAKWRKPLGGGATLYITLEPCSTAGRTGACTDVIVARRVPRVVIGTTDPNPAHNGNGLLNLRQAGINVVAGILEKECALLNEGFNKWITTGLPFVIAKCGMTLDGRLTLPPSSGRWITSAAARRDAREIRRTVDAVLVGAKTVRQDNPSLTIRPAGKLRQPWRIILTRSGRLPRRCTIFSDRFHERTVVYRNQSLRAVLRDLGKKNILSVLVEGGGDILGSLLDDSLIDKVQIYVAPLLSAGPVVAFAGKGAESTAQALHLHRLEYAKIGTDIRVTGHAAKKGTE